MLDHRVSPWEVKDELNANAARREALQQQLALQSDPRPLLHPDMGKLYREWVVESRAALAHEDTSNEAAAALRKIIDRITLTPENGKLGIVVQGELARLLSVSVPADQAEEFQQRVKMVAGACNRQYRPLSTLSPRESGQSIQDAA